MSLSCCFPSPSVLWDYVKADGRQVSVLRSIFGHVDKVSIVTRNLKEGCQKPTNKKVYFLPNGPVIFRKLACGLGLSHAHGQ